MRKNAKGSLDRRDFVIASLATIGASATFAATAGADKAQDTAASPLFVAPSVEMCTQKRSPFRTGLLG
jgi:hypothetical protein